MAASLLAELPKEMATLPTRRQLRTVHLFPKQDGWILMSLDDGERGKHYADLGCALDAATRRGPQLRVVVHERGKA